jgi:CoA:oxalate CoA-transferase
MGFVSYRWPTNSGMNIASGQMRLKRRLFSLIVCRTVSASHELTNNFLRIGLVMSSEEHDSNSHRPLTGKRVIEFGLFHAGPTCAAMLGALGAEVIKVEDVKRADPCRGLTRLYGQDCRLPDGRSIPFETYNAGKRSVALNLSHPGGMHLLHGLIKQADVFVHNVRDQTARTMRIDYDSVLVHNPRLVYASVSGFGPYGAEAARPGLDPVGLARSGIMAVMSGGSDKAPILPPSGIADHMAGILTAFGVLAAIIAHDQTDAPQRVESSLVGGAMWLGQLNLQYSLFSGKELLPLDPSSDPLLNSYQCADGLDLHRRTIRAELACVVRRITTREACRRFAIRHL